MQKTSVGLLFVVLLLATLFIGAASGSGRVLAQAETSGLPEGTFVARVYYEELADIERLAAYDLWEVNNLEAQYVLVSMDRRIYAELAGAGWRMEVDAEATAMLSPQTLDAATLAGYRSVDQLYADLAAISGAYPGLTNLIDYGDSFCKLNGGCVTPGGDALPGHDLLAMRVTNKSIPGPKPVFFLMANIHAREITTPELAMRFLDWLVQGYGVDADATWIVDYNEIWVVPTANPDGHWLVELGARPPYNGSYFQQRKSANQTNGCSVWPPLSFLQYGVDLNRNHSFMWNTGGSSGAACDQTYRGPSPASEPEVERLQNLISLRVPDQRGPNPGDAAPPNTAGLLITMHSYSNLVLWPWGNTGSAAPNYAGLKAIGDKLATYNGYTSCQSAVCLYTASGTTDDWAYGELGIPAYTFEIGTQFMPPYSEVDAVQWPDNGPALIYAAKIAQRPYRLVAGPDVDNVTATDNGDGTYTLTATIDDSGNGGQAIWRAAYFVDKPYWDGGSLVLMSASDGGFDSATEAVTATIDVSGWASGQHIVFVNGQDVQNNVGPATAVFITVP
ncbi:MAG: hypothetical protein KC425_21175 [Anaerolineales bacterium]|nr:hypothetical protein [Anaerolineales bacterium]